MPLQHLHKSSPLICSKSLNVIALKSGASWFREQFYPFNPQEMNAGRNHLYILPPMWKGMCIYLPTMVFLGGNATSILICPDEPQRPCYLQHFFLIFMPVEWVYLLLNFSVLLHIEIWFSSPIPSKKEFWVTSLRIICQKSLCYEYYLPRYVSTSVI